MAQARAHGREVAPVDVGDDPRRGVAQAVRGAQRVAQRHVAVRGDAPTHARFRHALDLPAQAARPSAHPAPRLEAFERVAVLERRPSTGESAEVGLQLSKPR